MNKLIVAIIGGLAVGFAAANWLIGDDEPEQHLPAEPASSDIAAFDSDAPVEERIRALEEAFVQERNARQVLEQEILFLTQEIARLDEGTDVPEEPMLSAREEIPQEFRSRRFGGGRTQGQVDRLVEAGFPVSQAEWIVQREAELQMERLQARYEAMRESGDSRFPSFTAVDRLRAELGDADYERYLAAIGRSISVGIDNVLSNSPAQRAGLQPGDRILRYDGERVFSMMDLAGMIMQGDAEGNVVVDIERGDMPMQLVIPRGPLGVMGD